MTIYSLKLIDLRGIKMTSDKLKTNISNLLYIPVSNGELIDKITILAIKSYYINDINKNNNIQKELIMLNNIAQYILNTLDKNIYDELYNINLELWHIEDNIRNKDKYQQFDIEFIKLAQLVYTLNDKRAIVKKTINQLTNSILIEEKNYV